MNEENNIPQPTPQNETPDQLNEVQGNPVSTPPSEKSSDFLFLSGIFLFALFFAVNYYLFTQQTLLADKNQTQALPPEKTPTPTDTLTPTPLATPTLNLTPNPPQTTEVSDVPLFYGKLTKIDRNLEIFKKDSQENTFYYEAGKFSQGELKDYSRILAIKELGYAGGGSQTFILATKDYQNYFLDDPQNLTVNYSENDYEYPYRYLDKTKIISTKTFETEQPQKINLDTKFALYYKKVLTNTVYANYQGGVDKTDLVTDFSIYKPLNSSFQILKFYFKPNTVDPQTLKNIYIEEQAQFLQEQNAILGFTEVIVVDSTGLPTTYSLTTQKAITEYENKLNQYKIEVKNYQDQIEEDKNNQNPTYHQTPNPINIPNLSFTVKDIENRNNVLLFNDYQTALPGTCSNTLDTKIFNLNESELEEIGSVNNIPLYNLKDKNHNLYKIQFRSKMGSYDKYPESWATVNPNLKKPTFEEYVAQNPLLFMKDYWNRWVGVGEFDIKLPGGCGKPVIYLYPEKPTEVSVTFLAPMKFSIDIPTYADYWKVLAHPNGDLINLRPELTDCKTLDYTRRGSEYAKDACEKNTYPYLYWAGNVTSKDYQTPSGGWIVENANVENFLQDKLTYMGLNENEKQDFMEYWLTDMMAKNQPYYRISFLQTGELNELVPMAINPMPDTMFRIFLDYSALPTKPQREIQPQNLERLNRKGFTLVEWGGLKKY